MTRKARNVVVSNRDGFHLRPAHAFVKLASQFDADISITKEGETIDGKSILSILTLAATRGAELEIVASGRRCRRGIGGVGGPCGKRIPR